MHSESERESLKMARKCRRIHRFDFSHISKFYIHNPMQCKKKYLEKCHLQHICFQTGIALVHVADLLGEISNVAQIWWRKWLKSFINLIAIAMSAIAQLHDIFGWRAFQSVAVSNRTENSPLHEPKRFSIFSREREILARSNKEWDRWHASNVAWNIMKYNGNFETNKSFDLFPIPKIVSCLHSLLTGWATSALLFILCFM